MMKTWAITDVGLVRKENQDAYRLARGGDVCVVCDGMGGAAGGQIASTLAAETYAAELEKILKPDMTPEQLREASSYAVAMANLAVENRASEDDELSNMGTTLVSAIAYEGGAVVTNVGDSRAYYITRAGITRITKDHSLVEEMVRLGEMDEEAAREHPKKNIITRAIGAAETVEPDFFEVSLQNGDEVLLCTDGLTNMVKDEEILQIIQKNTNIEKQAELLMNTANNNGGMDNITVMLIQPFSNEVKE